MRIDQSGDDELTVQVDDLFVRRNGKRRGDGSDTAIIADPQIEPFWL